jgi:gingipain R
MLNKFSAFFAALCLTGALHAQDRAFSNLQLLSSARGETLLQLDLTGVRYSTVTTPGGTAQIPYFEGGTPLLETGMPDLPKYALSLRIPEAANMKVEIREAVYEEYTGVDIAPSKGNLLRKTDPASVPYTYGTVYAKDAFYPGDLTALKQVFTLRDAQGQTLLIYPVQYNPVSKILRVYTSIQVRVFDASRNADDPDTDQDAATSTAFSRMYKQVFVNNDAFGQTGSGSLEPDKMLVIADDALVNDLEPLIAWKRQMGVHTTVVKASDAGGPDADAVYNFVRDYYNQHQITYLLIVGGQNAVYPLMRPSGGDNYSCDNCFGYMEGADHFPEIMVGRLHAANPEQLRVMVNRHLDYEMTPLADSLNNWTATAMASCSNEGEGIGDDGQADWQHANEWKIKHLADGYEKVWEFYDGNHADASPTPGDISADEPGDPVNTSLLQLMNTRGVSLYNYTGHGWEQGLVSGNFNTGAVAQLRNVHRYPILIAVACCSGNFTNNSAGDCLGEAFQRAGDLSSGEPWGGIAGFFSSDFQSWAPPMEGQDAKNEYLAAADGLSIKPNMGSMAVFGNARMIQAYGNGGEVMADFWNPFLDPTTQPRTRLPKVITAIHENLLPVNAQSLTVQSPVEGALAALYWQGQTLTTAYVENGLADLQFPALGDVGDMVLTVTQFNHTPYQYTIPVVPGSGPFVVSDLIELEDAAGNGNGRADYGETVRINLHLLNVGQQSATATAVQLRTNDGNVTLIDDSESAGDVDPSAALTLSQAFTFGVNPVVEDGHQALFNLKITFNDTLEYNKTFVVELHAPDLSVGSAAFDYNQGGNGNNYAESGETIMVRIPNNNTGGSASTDAIGTLSSDAPWLQISPAIDMGPLDALNGSAESVFEITILPNAPQAAAAGLQYTLQAGQYGAVEAIGLLVVNPIVEGFETFDFTAFPWEGGGNKNWIPTSILPYSGSHCVRSGFITHNESSLMSLTLDISEAGAVAFARRVSSEPDYDFLKFLIDGELIDSWSGNVSWGEVSYPVSAGLHTLTWVYEKDDVGTGGTDRAWVDEILLPAHNVVVATGDVSGSGFSVRAMPNPAGDRLTVQLDAVEQAEAYLELFDPMGRKVQQQRLPAGTEAAQLELQDLATGWYALRVQRGQAVMTVKVLKQ